MTEYQTPVSKLKGLIIVYGSPVVRAQTREILQATLGFTVVASGMNMNNQVLWSR